MTIWMVHFIDAPVTLTCFGRPLTEIVLLSCRGYRSFIRRLSGLVPISSCEQAGATILCKQEKPPRHVADLIHISHTAAPCLMRTKTVFFFVEAPISLLHRLDLKSMVPSCSGWIGCIDKNGLDEINLVQIYPAEQGYTKTLYRTCCRMDACKANFVVLGQLQETSARKMFVCSLLQSEGCVVSST